LYFGLDRITEAILSVRGLFVPGDAASEPAEAFAKSDLVISKGTGNWEALRGETGGKTTIYLLKAKCYPVAEQMEVEVGDFIVRVEK
jgi:hypothetical protein